MGEVRSGGVGGTPVAGRPSRLGSLMVLLLAALAGFCAGLLRPRRRPASRAS